MQYSAMRVQRQELVGFVGGAGCGISTEAVEDAMKDKFPKYKQAIEDLKKRKSQRKIDKAASIVFNLAVMDKLGRLDDDFMFSKVDEVIELLK